MPRYLPNGGTPLHKVRLAVVGTGALGSAVCQALLAANHRQVLLCDPDVVEERNLPLCPAFNPADLGLPKVHVLRRRAQTRQLPWRACLAEIADLGLQQLREIDVILCCPDNALARVETAFAARSLRLPMLDAGVMPNGICEGRVTAFQPTPGAACYLCGLPEDRRAQLLTYALSASLSCVPPAGLSSAMTGDVSTVQATAAALLQLLGHLPAEGMQGSFAVRIRPGLTDERIELTHSASCPWHALPPLCALPHDEPLATALRPGSAVDFPWPMCLAARCKACGNRCTPRRRTAWVRRRLPCPECGLPGTLEPLESVATVRADDPLAHRSLRQLGLPAGQLYHLRQTILAQGAAAERTP